MNTHKHARLTFLRRLEMVQQLIAHQVCVPEAARAYGVTAPTVRKWLGRFLAQGQAGLAGLTQARIASLGGQPARQPRPGPRRLSPSRGLRASGPRRSAAHRHQEAGTYPAPWQPGHGQPTRYR
ncbi:homeodomain-like domain protein [Bordetella pertussis STO1-CHOC-0019]|nr:homeodomain-like domain protein [Bordetella pertussis STO1-CHOC-0019]